LYAKVLRAEARLDSKIYEEALRDSNEAMSLIRASPKVEEACLPSFYATAYRVVTDAHACCGNLSEAIVVLHEWECSMPSYRTKISTTMNRILDQCAR
jgi:hypothetical protein